LALNIMVQDCITSDILLILLLHSLTYNARGGSSVSTKCFLAAATNSSTTTSENSQTKLSHLTAASGVIL